MGFLNSLESPWKFEPWALSEVLMTSHIASTLCTDSEVYDIHVNSYDTWVYSWNKKNKQEVCNMI